MASEESDRDLHKGYRYLCAELRLEITSISKSSSLPGDDPLPGGISEQRPDEAINTPTGHCLPCGAMVARRSEYEHVVDSYTLHSISWSA